MSHEETSSLLTLSTLIGGVVAYCVVATLYSCLTAPQPPISIPWQGYGKGWFAGARNFFATNKSREWLFEGYERYSKNNKAFVLPVTLGMQAEVVLPKSQMSWMFEQPDSVLSASEAHYDSLNGDYAFVEPVILREPFQEQVLQKHLVRSLSDIIVDLASEIPAAVEAIYGTNTDAYIKLDVMDSFMRMVPRLTNRMLVGPELSREQKFLDAVIGFTQDVVRTQIFMFLSPKAIQPLLGTILGWASTYHYWISSRYSIPVINKRLEELRKKDAGEPEYKDWKDPHDYITWSYRTAQTKGNEREARPDRIAKRIMPLNFAATHTTSLTAYETMVRILCADSSVVESLREEAHRVYQEEGGWTKQGLGRMYRMDSAIREAQRIAPMSLTLGSRKVIAKEGIITPEGAHVPYGVLLSCPWMPLALDSEIHDGDATLYDAFRYSRPREAYEAMTTEEKEDANANALKLKQTGLVTTSNHHLPFGHGRHACPGRFFISHELKMIFAHLLLNYDFKPFAEMPQKLWVVRFHVPLPALVQVKRRKTPWQAPD